MLGEILSIGKTVDIYVMLAMPAAFCRASSLAGLNTKIHLAVDANGMPVRFFVTDATVADCSIAEALTTEFQAEYLLADRAYDTIRSVLQAGMMPVIPPKKNRKVLRNYDKHIYKPRHLVENSPLAKLRELFKIANASDQRKPYRKTFSSVAMAF